jgi:D-cysteine desulfhydrase
MSLADAMARLPSVGWVRAPSPVTRLEALAQHLGLASLDVKRDDLLDALHGGNKARKLDVLLATAPFKDAPRFASLGAIGSGHLAACTAAAQALGKTLDAHVFFEALSDGVLENLAFVASGPTTLHEYATRVELGVRHPSLVLSTAFDGVPLIPPGGTMPAGIAGVARAGFELAEQLRAGALEAPDAVYCALGTGGTVAGLALGLGLAGVKTEVRAVATVERVFTSVRAVRRLIAQAAHWLRSHGVEADEKLAVPVRLIRNQLGAGYGTASAQSLAAVEVLHAEGVPIEPIYTGKAFAALLADAAAGRAPKRVLFWNTVRRGPLPHDPRWRAKLPPRLGRFLDRSTTCPSRRLVLAGGAAALGAVAWSRLTGYEPIAWTGQVLSSWEAQVVAAAAPVLSGVEHLDGLTVAANVDRFLVTTPPAMKAEIHQLMGLVEHGTGLGLQLRRFTKLDDAAREAFLLSLNVRGGLLAQAFRGLRDLVLMGTYQQERSWQGLGYGGPLPEMSAPELVNAKYDTFRAPPGAVPKSGGGA